MKNLIKLSLVSATLTAAAVVCFVLAYNGFDLRKVGAFVAIAATFLCVVILAYDKNYETDYEAASFQTDMHIKKLNEFNDPSGPVNPANGLPMVGGIGGVDIQGNTFGVKGR